MADQANYSFSILNVGQGSLQLIEEGSHTNIAIDCNLQAAPEFVARYFGRRKVKQIDLLILSGTDADHADADGLEFLSNNYEIKRLWYPDYQKDEETDNWKKVRKLIARLEKAGTIVETPKAGHSFNIGALNLKVLSPHDDDSTSSNNASIVVRVVAGDVSAIFPGDCEILRWANIAKYFADHLPANIFLVPHHGSDNGCNEEVIKAVKPEYAVISAGKDNKYGHPDGAILKLLRKYTQKEIFITHEDGSILFESDGATVTNVVPNAGQDEDGKKAAVTAVATALNKRTPVFVSRSGALSTAAAVGSISVRPTVSHGGARAERDAEMNKAPTLSDEAFSTHVSKLLSTFESVQPVEPAEITKLDHLAARKFSGADPRAAFTASLTTNYGNKHKVLIVVPKSYPAVAPAVYVLNHIRGQYAPAHIYSDDQRCCLFEKYGRDWNPKECDLVTILSWAATWLFCQEFFQKTGSWPAPESHKTRARRRSKPWDARRRN
jgi:competence protein ComEC